MLYGCDDQDKRISAEDAERSGIYSCPVCGAKLVLKRGDINIPHFAHEKNSKCDSLLENKMTLWHIQHQMYFGSDEREVILQADGVKHIADVKTGNVIIEFQHSPISYDDFKERSDFYRGFGTIIWVFDMKDKVDRIHTYVAYSWAKECDIFCFLKENTLSKPPYWSCWKCQYNRAKATKVFNWKNSSRMLGKCNFEKMDSSGMKCFFQIGNDEFVHVKWNKDGVSLFGGDVMSLDGFHKFIRETAMKE